MTQNLPDLKRCAVHTITTKPWPIETAIEKYAARGFGGVTVWRDALQDRNIAKIGNDIRGAGMDVVALVRSGFFPHRDAAQRDRALDDNRRAIDEAAALGAPMVVLVCGAIPGLPLRDARQQIREGIEAVLPHAQAHNVKLAIEPLHPMYADDRSAINTLASANDLAEAIDSDHVGVAVDVYHLWWDPDLEYQIRRCGKNGNLLAFHVCDWNTPTTDMLLDRGLMGEGCIPIREIRGWVEQAGFNGFNEVEIFSKKYWETDQDQWLEKIAQACLHNV